jgi:hypothetical protein
MPNGDDGRLYAAASDDSAVPRGQVAVVIASDAERGGVSALPSLLACGVLPDLVPPPDSWLPGRIPAQEARCAAEGNRVNVGGCFGDDDRSGGAVQSGIVTRGATAT